ncbi:hypothetical protein Nmel_014443 [Mimus melanotis]
MEAGCGRLGARAVGGGGAEQPRSRRGGEVPAAVQSGRGGGRRGCRAAAALRDGRENKMARGRGSRGRGPNSARRGLWGGSCAGPARPHPLPRCRSVAAGCRGAPVGAAPGSGGEPPSAGEGGGGREARPSWRLPTPSPGKRLRQNGEAGPGSLCGGAGAGAAGRSPPRRGHRARCPGRAAAHPPRSAPIRSCLRKVEQNGET